MTRERRITLLEGIGIVAIVASLIFVGLELKQNTDAMQAETIQSLTGLSQEYLLLLGTDKEANRILNKGRTDLSALDETEFSQYLFLQLSRLVRYQMAFLQWRRGTLGDEDWSFYRGYICSEKGSAYWKYVKPELLDSFVKFVESC